jgi:hypothetical protein
MALSTAPRNFAAAMVVAPKDFGSPTVLVMVVVSVDTSGMVPVMG